MKTIFAFLLTAIAVFTFTSSFSQLDCSGGRYVNEIFPSVTTTSNVLYGNNINWLGSSEDLYLDIYEPTGDTDSIRPLIIIAHGGTFVFGDKADGCVDVMCQDLAKLGYVTASINYRLGIFPVNETNAVRAVHRATHDARAAVRFFRKNFVDGGNTYKIDTSRIFFGGQSAGAFMAIHLAYLDEISELPSTIDTTQSGMGGGMEGNSGNPGYSSKVTAIISMAGAIGDTAWMKAGDAPIISFHGDQDGTVPFGTDLIYIQGTPIMVVDGSSTVHIKANELGINNCFKPYWGQGHVPECGPPADPAYTDTAVTYTKHFLLQFVCNEPNICDYNYGVGIEEQEFLTYNNFKIYPNPATLSATLILNKLKVNKYDVELYDNMGRLLKRYIDQKNDEFVLKRNDLNSGLYFINIISGNSNYTGKVIFE